MSRNKPNVSLMTKREVRRDYVLGRGSVSSLSRGYKLSKHVITKWLVAENWTVLRDEFAAKDDVFETKRQLFKIDEMILKERDPFALKQLCHCKEILFETYCSLLGVPRRPMGKLPKEEKPNKLRELMSAVASDAAKNKKPVIDLEPTENVPLQENTNPENVISS